jgi:hypothetical protein
MSESTLGQWVQVTFDCLPLRSVQPSKVPTDASPKLAAKLQRIQAALTMHGTLGSYYLHNATCTYYLTNDPSIGMCQFAFEGVVLTDGQDMQARSCDLQIELLRDTCGWINQSIVSWLAESVQRAVMVDFDRYVRACDLTKTIERLELLQKASDESGGFVGMYL